MKKVIFPIALAAFFLFGCGHSTEKKNQDVMPAPDTSKGISAMKSDTLKTSHDSLVYVCPCGGCPEVRESKPGNCPKCGLKLEVEKKKPQ